MRAPARLARVALVALLAVLTLPGSVLAHEDAALRQALQRLEARVQLLEARVGATPGSAPAEPAPARAARGEVAVRYWLGRDDPFTTEPTPPVLRQGRHTLAAQFELSPAHFGHQSSGVFDPLQDSSSYPLAALAIDAQLHVAASGDYQLVLHATPPREVGGAGQVSVALALWLDGVEVARLAPSSGLAPRSVPLQLSAGSSRLRLTLVARSPGFGPSPTQTRIEIGLRGVDALTPTPLAQLLSYPLPE